MNGEHARNHGRVRRWTVGTTSRFTVAAVFGFGSQDALAAARFLLGQFSGVCIRRGGHLLKDRLRHLDAMCVCPDELFGGRKAAALPPAHLGVHAATPAVHTGKRCNRVFNQWDGQWYAERRDSDCDGGQNARTFQQEVADQVSSGGFHGSSNWGAGKGREP